MNPERCYFQPSLNGPSLGPPHNFICNILILPVSVNPSYIVVITQSHYPDTEPTSPCPILIIPSTWLSKKRQVWIFKSLAHPEFESVRSESPDLQLSPSMGDGRSTHPVWFNTGVRSVGMKSLKRKKRKFKFLFNWRHMCTLTPSLSLLLNLFLESSSDHSPFRW